MPKADTLIYNIGELVTVGGADRPRVGAAMNELGIMNNAAVAIQDGKFCAVGSSTELTANWQATQTLDAVGALVTPGLVDAHTHPVFAATRELEFEMRIQGATYQEIAQKGGGIRNSVRKLRQMPKSQLKELVRKRLTRFLHLGTTTIEAKSGYGLSLEDEIKSLEILAELAQEHPVEIVPTFMGAHEFPDEYQNDHEGYVNLIITRMIPEIARRKLAQYCDVFCEKGVFGVAESRRILQAAERHGLGLKIHAEEFVNQGGAELAAELKATSAEHLMAISDQGIDALKTAGVVAVLLPATTLFLRCKNYAPARKMLDSGVAIALSTDFNPGSSMTQSLPMVLTLAALQLGMTPAQSLVAVTINAACAIGRGKDLGSISPGKKADLVVWDATTYRYLSYHFGDNLVGKVFKAGKLVVERNQEIV